MPKWTIKLLKREKIAPYVLQFTLEKPFDFTFHAGQFAGFTLTLANEQDVKGSTRRFSLASAPHTTHIEIVTKIHETGSSFKRSLITLPLGAELRMVGPAGHFVLPNNLERPIVFLAGGIGVTPFLSMIRHASYHQSPQSLYLFYSVRTKEDILFLEELVHLQKINPHFTCIITLTGTPPLHWQGETGRLNKAILNKHITDITQPLYYICGSAQVVSAFYYTLKEIGVTEESILTEEFPGY